MFDDKQKMKNKMMPINSISQYIKYLEKYNLYDSISRGESKKYDCIQASAFRRYKDAISDNHYYNKTHIKAFYNHIGNELTPLQTDNFLAVAQHHGLPTNLIDFSYSPLVSLFFACYKENELDHDETDGFVYFIKKDRLLNINMLIGKDFTENLFEEILKLDNKFNELKALTSKHKMFKGAYYYEAIEKLFEIYFQKYPQHVLKKPIEFALNGYGKDLIVQFMLDPQFKMKMIDEQRKENDFAYIIKNIIDLITDSYFSDSLIHGIPKSDIEKAKNICKKAFPFSNFPDTEWALFFILRCILSDIDTKFELPFYFTYTPPDIIKRVMSQNSVFIYQLYHEIHIYHENHFDNEKSMDYRGLITQNIVPDYILKIRNRKKILMDLDMLGINLKSIYGDFDNIAKYIKNKI